MTPIRALIVDDEAPARDEMAYLLEAHDDVRATTAANAQEALRLLASGEFDLVFQDIQMPGQDGFHVLAEAQDFARPPLFVFVTAFDQHAIRAFEENAVDYLLKPVSPERLAKSLVRVRKALGMRPREAARDEGWGHPSLPGASGRQEQDTADSGRSRAASRSTGPPDCPPGLAGPPGAAEEAHGPAGFSGEARSAGPGILEGDARQEDLLRRTVERLLASVGRPMKPLARLAVEQGGRIAMISVSRVLLVEADDKRVTALTDQGRLTCHGLSTLARAAQRLAGLPFFQANRAQLVNLERIAEFAPWFGGKYALTLNDPERTEVTVSRNRVREFKMRLGI